MGGYENVRHLERFFQTFFKVLQEFRWNSVASNYDFYLHDFNASDAIISPRCSIWSRERTKLIDEFISNAPDLLFFDWLAIDITQRQIDFEFPHKAFIRI